MEHRNIKFRMWTGSKMIYDTRNVIECLRQQIDHNNGDKYGYDHIGLHNSAFMQYTGLKDKNGVEIYEGDVLEIKASWGTYKAIVKYGLIGKDGEQHAAFGYYIPNEDGKMESYYLTLIDIFTSNEVVVGNIYEHPEYL